jgi:hypothetical protein
MDPALVLMSVHGMRFKTPFQNSQAVLAIPDGVDQVALPVTKIPVVNNIFIVLQMFVLKDVFMALALVLTHVHVNLDGVAPIALPVSSPPLHFS